MYLDGGMGGGGWLLTSFFSIIYILGLVCYKHTIHETMVRDTHIKCALKHTEIPRISYLRPTQDSGTG